jgi:hypothetical protein
MAGRQRHDLGLAEHRDGGEVKARKRLAGGQVSLGEMARDAPATSLGELVLGKRREEARRRPAFLVGLGGKLLAHQPDGG